MVLNNLEFFHFKNAIEKFNYHFSYDFHSYALVSNFEILKPKPTNNNNKKTTYNANKSFN